MYQSIRKQKVTKLKGWNMIELAISIAIIGLLGSATAVVTTKNIRKTNIDKTSSFLQILATDLGDAYNDIGAPTIEPNEEGITKFKNFITEIQDGYLACTFDLNSVKPQSNGFSISIDSPKDAFGNKYLMEFITVDGKPPFSRISSNGADNVSSRENYINQEYGDDIVAIVYPKD